MWVWIEWFDTKKIYYQHIEVSKVELDCFTSEEKMKGIFNFLLGITIGYFLRNFFELSAWVEIAIIVAVAFVLYAFDKMVGKRRQTTQ